VKLRPEQLEWLRHGGRQLIRAQVKAMLAQPERYGTEVLRWFFLLPDDILISVLDPAGEGAHYCFDHDDPTAEVYYEKNRRYFDGTGIAVSKRYVKDLYGLAEDEVYLQFDYRGEIAAIRREVLHLLEEMPPPPQVTE